MYVQQMAINVINKGQTISDRKKQMIKLTEEVFA
jgi:hypothetical protein